MRGDIAPAERIPDSGITGAYQFFVDAIEEFVEQSVDETDVVLGELAQILLEGLQIVVIDLSPTDNAQVIFETMNARGTPLLASDLIKNLIFRTLHEGGRNAEAAYENYWQRFEAEKWREEISQGRLKRPRIDAFVGHLLTVLTNGEVLSHQLFPEFRRHLARAVDPADGAEQMLRDMARYADVYEAIETWRGASQAETDLLRRLAISETTTVTPVLMWLLANDGWSSRLCALRALDSYLTRRTLCRLTTKNYNRMFLTLLQRMKTVPEPAELVEQYLAEQSSTSGAWPSDLQLERDFEELPLYGFLPRPRLNRILQELERAARSEFSEPIEIKGKTTLEHLMPQAWRDHWPMPDSASEEAASGRDRLVHTIGNLTLLTGPLNSSLSNGPWSDKRADILKHSALSLNRSLPEEWDEDEIRMRSLELADLAARLWPRPVLDSSRPAFIDERERVTRPEAETARPVVRGTRPSTRRNVAVHIAEAFTQVPIGTTMSVGQIAKFESQEYAGAKVSQGAISALIKRGATIPGLRFQTSPVAGATKLGEVAVPAGPDPGRSRSDHAEVRARLSAVGNPGRYLADE